MAACYAGPIEYQSRHGEKWRLLAKGLTGGRVILGISGLDGFADPDSILRSSAALSAGPVRDAARVSRNKLSN